MTSKPPPPRLYCIVATHAPVALVFRKGAGHWNHLLRWWLDEGRLEPGVWVKKKLFPRRFELSSDGQLLTFLLHGGFMGKYQVFSGVSRAPWLHPLARLNDNSVISCGWTFLEGPTTNTWNGSGAPHAIELQDRPVTLQRNDNSNFLHERRRGWTESPDWPSPAADAYWTERCNVHLERSTPSGHTLHLFGGHYQPEGGIEGLAPTFELEYNGQRQPLDNLYWADWDHSGRLLMATRSGLLHAATVRESTIDITETHDLNNMTPNPQPAPAWAMH
jgi:hypothetical protein